MSPAHLCTSDTAGSSPQPTATMEREATLCRHRSEGALIVSNERKDSVTVSHSTSRSRQREHSGTQPGARLVGTHAAARPGCGPRPLFALVLDGRLQGHCPQQQPVLPTRAGPAPERAKAAGVGFGSRPRGTRRRDGDGRHRREGPVAVKSDPSNKPNNIGTHTFRKTSVRSRITPRVTHTLGDRRVPRCHCGWCEQLSHTLETMTDRQRSESMTGLCPGHRAS